MQSSAAHIAEAQKFESVLADLETTTHYGWVLVLRFYVVLHYVEAFLQTKLQRRRDHEARRFDMSRVPETAAILADYRILEKLSREARYECTPFRPKDLADYGPVYLNVRTAMRGALGLPP